MNTETFEKVKALLMEHFDLKEEQITEDLTFEDLGADSLDMVEFVMGIEEAFEVEFEDEKIENLSDIQDAVSYIDQLRAQK
ncbi:acyl carrier protein [Facklamia miroungae]|uniref:Acyl carrier protein n=1 Tax=Facklamia miroungae TaxID=120956 RepID=A0A1G7PQ78_9LACT|nr:acyl carrier protein [Facklamia miroungae]NKZ28788.1 acyl carrier protein [Facklamia miroungae]SDF88384.1 acyl carrier protein [Facklamia miroungae]